MRLRWLRLITAGAFILLFCANPATCSRPKDDSGIGTEDATSRPEAFVPTHEWQEVGPDQAIPPGLHVRMDFQTGKKEAKLMDVAAENRGALVAVDREDATDGSPGGLLLGPGQLFDKVQNDHKNFRVKHWAPNAVQNIQELVLKLTPTPGANVEELAETLEVLEEEVHDIQRAGMFMAAGGVTKVIAILKADGLAHHKAILAKAAKVLGSSVQSNPDLQLHAMDEGGLGVLIGLLMDATALDRLEDIDMLLANAVGYACAALLRDNPRAQSQLSGETEILHTLAKAFDHSGLGDNLRTRIVTSLTDVLDERTVGHDALLHRLATDGWCSRLKRYLRHAVDLDTSQRALKAVYATLDACGNVYSSDQGAMEQIRALSLAWQEEAQLESDKGWAEYLHGLQALAEMVLSEALKCNSSHPCELKQGTLIKEEL